MKNGNDHGQLRRSFYSLAIIGGLIVMAAMITGAVRAERSGSSVSPVAATQSVVVPGTKIASERLSRTPMFQPPLPQALPSVETFAGGCTTPQVAFNVGQNICVKTSGIPVSPFFPHRLILVNANSTVVFSSDITSDPQTDTFTLDATSVVGGVTVDNRGTWHAFVLNPFFFFQEASTSFTVSDSQNATADIGVSASSNANEAQAGSQVIFQLQVKNYGPDNSATVQLVNPVPANTTFVDFQQLSGPTFVCSSPDAGATGTTTCSLASFAWPGPDATFVAVYQINSGVATDTAIVDTASISSVTNDQNIRNDSSSSTVTVSGASGGDSCTFTCPANMIATATGPDGAIVTFSSAENIAGSCGAITASPSSGTVFPVGTTVVNVSSEAGPTCSFTVTVSDTPAPTISCPVDQNVTADGSGTYTFAPGGVGTPTTTPTTGVTVTFERSDDVPAVLDEDGNVVTPAVIYSLTDPFPTGTTGITWTVVDSIARTATCTQRIVVHAPCASDTQPPTITAPPDITTATGPNSTTCGVVLDDELGHPTVTDDCSATFTVSGIPPGNLFPVGTTALTYTATDGAGHTVSATQHVTVTDNTPPEIAAPADASYTCPSDVPAASASQAHGTNPNLTNGGPVFDNCGVQSVTVAETSSGAGSAASPRIITRTFTATDVHGNSASAVQTITVIDSTPPTITAPADVSANTGPGATSCDAVVSNATLGTASASDNCAGVTVSRSPSGNTFSVGTTTVTWTATDWAGNTATATQTVTVTDNTPPVVTAPANVTAYTGPDATSCGTVVSDATLGTATASDNCPGIGAITRTGVPSGNAFPVGNTTVTYSVTDAHGNSSSATQTVTVIDNTPPVITTNGQTPSMWPPNHDYQTFSVTNFVTSVFDNCGGVSVGDVVIEKATSDEAEDADADGSTLNDIVIASDCRSVQLRSERSGTGNGRVYTITFRLVDTHGNITRVTANVVVPHNTGETPVNSGVHYTVNGTCP